MNISNKVLEKARAINQKKKEDKNNKVYLNEILSANLCPQCGEGLVLDKQPVPWIFSSYANRKWICSKRCGYETTEREKTGAYESDHPLSF